MCANLVNVTASESSLVCCSIQLMPFHVVTICGNNNDIEVVVNE